ncbi:MAG: UPF0182 family protein [Thaumarchaeota archaeon]|nr:UPF0182 family protein [Nitrososphaerota archaeon]
MEDETFQSPRFGIRRVRLILVALVILFVVFTVVGQVVWFWLNILEFGDVYLRPIYFQILGGSIIAAFVLIRIDFRNRRSIIWWLVRLLLGFSRFRTLEELPSEYLDFDSFKMGRTKFLLWQLTKVLLGTLVFSNLILGMSVQAMSQGWDSGLGRIWSIFSLPFVTPQGSSFAQESVIPLIPALTLVIPSVIGAIELRLVLLLGLTQFIRVLTPSPRVPFGSKVAALEALFGVVLVWIGIKAFFPSYIDYNAKIVIGGLWSAGTVLLFLAYLDGLRRKGRTPLILRQYGLRILSLFIIALLAFSSTSIQNSTADAAKQEWLGPYVSQEVAVNRYLAGLDDVKEVDYTFGIRSIPPAQIESYSQQQSPLLSKVRLWDSQSAFQKLKPEVGLLPFINFSDSDILRFNRTLYWSASMKPILPSSVETSNRWYAEHLVYTNVPNGFLLIDGSEGKIIESSQFFNQRRIYYGESGLFNEVWAAFPKGGQVSAEVGGFRYNGVGGVEVSPPLSWLFEFNFLLALRDQTVNVQRYRDPNDRMQLLFPYFEYQTRTGRVDIFPVTDGNRTFWLMPLIVNLDTSHVPWSSGNEFKRLLGYALIDIFDGTYRIISISDDYFTDLFKTLYGDVVTTEIPTWLQSQMRYPEELFEWRVGMYNFYHVTAPDIFISAKEFYEVPSGLDTYYVIAKPFAFESEEFVGILSLELRGAAGRNLAGYMVVRNDFPNFGEMIFYRVPLESQTKLLGPSAVVEALDRNPDFAQLKTLLRNPRIGDNILYRVGDHDLYFIPVYTAGSGGVVSQLGTVAAVGAAFTGEYHVGLGANANQAFRAYLSTLGGVAAPPTIGKEDRLQQLVDLFESKGIKAVRPISINPDVTFNEGKATYLTQDQFEDAESLIVNFINTWAKGRSSNALLWTEGENANFGVLLNVDGVVELRFITISLE